MQNTLIKILPRTDKPKVLRKQGLIPGVVYGEGYEGGVPVQLERRLFSRIINTYGTHAKVWTQMDGNRRYGIIKEVQREHVGEDPSHFDILLIAQNDDLRTKVPLTFSGTEELEYRNLMLQTYNTKIDVWGKVKSIPDYITVDVSNKKLRDAITVADLQLDDNLKVYHESSEILAVVTGSKGAKASAAEAAG